MCVCVCVCVCVRACVYCRIRILYITDETLSILSSKHRISSNNERVVNSTGSHKIYRPTANERKKVNLSLPFL